MFAYGTLGEEPQSQEPAGVTPYEAGDIATNNALMTLFGGAVVFYLIYTFLIKK